jgi:uncharacterized LabA/DUF88 family protein
LSENEQVVGDSKPAKIIKRKVIVYIDGFNLYFAINEMGWRNLLWLDLVKLANSLIDPNKQELVAVKYFTSYIKKPAEKRKRQLAYIDALGTLPLLKIVTGEYIENRVECRGCHRTWRDDKEKQTDVHIATAMITDALAKGRVDDLLLVTADSDQIPAIEAVRFFKKHVLIVIPPGRTDYLGIQRAAGGNKLELTKTKLAACLLPPKVKTQSGFEVQCPAEYL